MSPNMRSYPTHGATKKLIFQDFKNLDKAQTISGFSKIVKTCQLTRQSGIKWAWIDTCCIDKKPSAELSESINSMYSWHRQSVVCYAYISDWRPTVEWVHLRPVDEDFTGHKTSLFEQETSYQAARHKDLNNSMHKPMPLRWFTRGWTLQELIAPTRMEFYDQAWNFKGLKSDPMVVENLSRITAISEDILQDGSIDRLRETSLGQRMSWAAHRETSRIEDTAYCLLGIFQVNMPMLYGEGDRAFFRLQEEIIKFSTDLTLFAWTQHHADEQEYRGILSCHPREFAGLRDCVLLNTPYLQAEEIAITNKGFRIHTLLYYPDTVGKGVRVLYLGFLIARRPHGITLRRVGENVYVRHTPKQLTKVSMNDASGEARTIYTTRHWDRFRSFKYSATLADGVKVRFWASILKYSGAWPGGIYDAYSSTLLIQDLAQVLCFIEFTIFDSVSLTLSTPMDHFIVICHRIYEKVSVRLLKGDEAAKVKEEIQLRWILDPSVLQDMPDDYYFKNSRPKLFVLHKGTGVPLQISAEVITTLTVSGREENVININAEVVH